MTVDEILEALRAIVDGANAEDRDLTEEEAERYEQLEVQLRDARRSAEIRQRQAAYDTPVRDPKLEAVVHTAAAKTDDTLERAFDHWVRTGQENADVVELRAQGEATGPAGGYLVPTTMLQRLTERMKAFGGLEAVADNLNTSTGETIAWPSLDDTGNTAEIVAEAGAPASGADLVFGKRELGAYRFTSTGAGGNPLRVSLELLADNAYDIEGRIMAKLGQRIARAVAPYYVVGTGVGQPEGILHGASVANGRAVELADDTNGITYDDLVGFIHSVDPAYRELGNCRWAFNDATLKTIKLIKDSNGDPIWRPLDADMSTSTGGGVLLGFPVTIDQAFPDVDVDNNTVNWGVFGDIREGLVVRNVAGVVVIRDPYARKSQGEVEFVAHARRDSIQNDKDAYVALTGEQ